MMDIEEKTLQYGVFLGRRFKEKEKLVFLARMEEEFKERGYETRALKKDLKRFQGINLYVGDVVNSDNLVIAHYDTPLNAFSKKMKFYPFDIARSEKAQQEQPKIYALSAILIGMVIMFLASYLFKIQGITLNIIWVVTTVLMTLVGYIFLRGFPNPVSANLNTSGVLALLDIASHKPKNTAFVLTDRECVDNFGDVMLNEALPETLAKKNVIHLKAIGNGKNIVIGHTEENTKRAKDFASKGKNVKLFNVNGEQLNKHSLNYYQKALSVSVANKFNDVWEIDNVYNDKDLKIDSKRFKSVVDLVLNNLE